MGSGLAAGALTLVLVACGGPNGGAADDEGGDPATGGQGAGAGGSGGEAGGGAGGGGSGGAGGSAGGGAPGVPGAPGWKAVDLGVGTDELTGVDFAGAGDGLTGFIVGRAPTLLNTRDGGEHWTSQKDGFFKETKYTEEMDAHILSPPRGWGVYQLLDVHAVSPTVVWASSLGPLKAAAGSWGADQLSAIFRSEDGGASWTRVILATNFQVWGIHGFDGKSARAASIGSSSHTDSDVYLIDDGVDRASVGVDWGALRDITFADTANGWLAGDAIYRSKDGGKSWNPQKAPRAAQWWSVCFVDANNGWAVGAGGVVVHTSNGGALWTAQTSGTKNVLKDVRFFDESHGFAVGEGGVILRTSDGGAMWAAEKSGTTANLNAVEPVSPTYAWAVGEKGTVLRRD